MEARQKKQLIIGGAYLILITAIAFSVYWAGYRPTCSDNVKNGKEEGIDCGALACGIACPNPVEALNVQSVELVRTPAGDYDIAAQIYNPNSQYGVSEAIYDMVFADNNGQELSRKKSRTFYMLPGQTKYIVSTALKNIPIETASARLELQNVEWRKESNPLPVTFTNTRDALTRGPGQTIFETTILNDSDFDFDNIDVVIVVSDDSGRLVATNVNNIQTLLSKSERYIKVSWPFILPAGSHILVDVGTNVFNNSNFLERSATQEEFQQYFQEGPSF